MKKMNAMIASAMVVGGLMGGISTNAMAATHSNKVKMFQGGHQIQEITDFVFTGGSEVFVLATFETSPNGVILTSSTQAGSGRLDVITGYEESQAQQNAWISKIGDIAPLNWMLHHGYRKEMRQSFPMGSTFLAPQLTAQIRKQHPSAAVLALMGLRGFPTQPVYQVVTPWQGAINNAFNTELASQLCGRPIHFGGTWLGSYNPRPYRDMPYKWVLNPKWVLKNDHLNLSHNQKVDTTKQDFIINYGQIVK